MAVNTLPLQNVYPTMGNYSLGQMGRGDTPSVIASGGDVPEEGGHVEEALRVGGQANPLVGLLVFGIMVVLVYLLARQFGEDGDFSNIKATAYNALFISIVAVAGIPVWKYLFTRVKVPGVSTWVLSS